MTERIESFMRAHPHTIGRDQPVARAKAVMHEGGFRHLPVLDAGRIVGIVTERDLAFVENVRGGSDAPMLVEEAMTAAPYTVSRDTPLAEVCRTMAKHHYGCALVMEDDKVLGIFTTVDALEALAKRAK